jgi:hypothetical protein
MHARTRREGVIDALGSVLAELIGVAVTGIPAAQVDTHTPIQPRSRRRAYLAGRAPVACRQPSSRPRASANALKDAATSAPIENLTAPQAS